MKEFQGVSFRDYYSLSPLRMDFFHHHTNVKNLDKEGKGHVF